MASDQLRDVSERLMDHVRAHGGEIRRRVLQRLAYHAGLRARELDAVLADLESGRRITRTYERTGVRGPRAEIIREVK